LPPTHAHRRRRLLVGDAHLWECCEARRRGFALALYTIPHLGRQVPTPFSKILRIAFQQSRTTSTSLCRVVIANVRVAERRLVSHRLRRSSRRRCCSHRCVAACLVPRKKISDRAQQQHRHAVARLRRRLYDGVSGVHRDRHRSALGAHGFMPPNLLFDCIFALVAESDAVRIPASFGTELDLCGLSVVSVDDEIQVPGSGVRSSALGRTGRTRVSRPYPAMSAWQRDWTRVCTPYPNSTRELPAWQPGLSDATSS